MNRTLSLQNELYRTNFTERPGGSSDTSADGPTGQGQLYVWVERIAWLPRVTERECTNELPREPGEEYRRDTAERVAGCILRPRVCAGSYPNGIIADMGERIPLPSLLSHALVAFTIEFDNEYERRMPHWTTRQGRGVGTLHAPWLVSMVMWSNCMCFVSEAGVAVRELERLARTKTNLPGMERWGYVVVEPSPADHPPAEHRPAEHRPKPPRSAWLVRPTAAGRKAQEVWRPLFGEIEGRWQKRFGKNAIEELRKSLWAVAGQLDIELPDCLPILGFGLFSKGTEYERRVPGVDDDGSRLSLPLPLPLPLPAILSRVLLAFALDFENESDLSLAISANLVRVLNEQGVRVRDLPLLTGVSKEAIAVSLSFLTKRGYAVVEGETSGGRAKVARLTPKGRKAQEVYRQLLSIEQRWEKRFGKSTVRALRDSLERLVGEPTAELSPLFRGLEPYPDGWRASLPRPSTLPHYPMVLHRGGFPDGS